MGAPLLRAATGRVYFEVELVGRAGRLVAGLAGAAFRGGGRGLLGVDEDEEQEAAAGGVGPVWTVKLGPPGVMSRRCAEL